MVLTDRGRPLLDSGRPALQSLSASEQRFRAEAGHLSGVVRIGHGPIPAWQVAHIVVPEVRIRWPDICLEVELGTAQALVAETRRGMIDIALCHTEDIEFPPGVHREHLQTLRAVLLVSQTHPLLAEAPVPGAALAPYALASLAMPYPRFARWYHGMVGEEAKVALIGSDYQTLAETVARSELLLFAPRSIASHLARSHGLAELAGQWDPFLHDVQLVARNQFHLPEIEAVIDIIREKLGCTEE